MTIKKIGLGSAQWGSLYGVSNSNGKTTKTEISKMFSIARSEGIHIIDTAPLYGDAEKKISEQNLNGFGIITKIPKFSKSKMTKNDAIELNRALEKSLKLLGLNQIRGILLHDASDIMVEGGEYISDALHDFKDRGFVKKIGASIYDSKNLDRIYERLKPDIIQLPINVLDQRLIRDGTLKYLKHKGVEIHARSIFLQGLLLMLPSTVPEYFKPWKDVLNSWHTACLDQKFNFLQAALSFVANTNELDYYILGFENCKQMKECISALSMKRKFDAKNIGCSDVDLVNPVNWRLS